MKTRIMKCTICEKKLLVCTKQHLASPYSPEYRNPKSPTYGKSKRTFIYSDSKDGILFERNKNFHWFCNSCWKEIISKVKFDN